MKVSLSRASSREREGTHREAMGRVRESSAGACKPSPGALRLRSVATLSRFKARERDLEMVN
jgi:hypothetical protein